MSRALGGLGSTTLCTLYLIVKHASKIGISSPALQIKIMKITGPLCFQGHTTSKWHNENSD